ncbi:hypothetical protein NGRA_0962 [Nosema granulosis]|uniref:SHSP domain-containing protein n=1 Tax=Nosema granulosis TaxID=83296 RepID=A0A9P6KZM9_9MICR|nr:hypothetical protein NGRA_0962 [Nosema granulosis]
MDSHKKDSTKRNGSISENDFGSISSTIKIEDSKVDASDHFLSEAVSDIVNKEMLLTEESSYTAIYDEYQNTIKELGFEEKIKISQDFKPDQIKIKVDEKKFTVFGKVEQPIEEKSTTFSTHTFGYVREFNRPIRNVEMEVGSGVVNVYGEFADCDYPKK